jgi:hypothetical protein
MNKAEQIKQQQRAIKTKTTPEKLLKLQEQNQRLQEKINPLGGLSESLTASTKAFQIQSPFAELAKNPLLEQITASTKIFDSLRVNHWTETIFKINNIIPKIDFPKWDFQQYKPLYEYGLGLQEIQIRFTAPEIVKSFQSMQDLATEIHNAKSEVENNFWHNLTVEEYEFETEKDKEKITELEQKIIEQEKIIAAYQLIVSVQQPQSKAQKPLSQTLRPNITQSQIARLYEYLKGIFEATPEQWRALFSETEIQLAKPIKAVAVADIVVLFHHLREREFVETSKYPSVLERTKAFSINDKIVTAKMINKPKAENYNFPLIGKNYDNINKAVSSL